MGVLDCMLLNARLMWNISVDSDIGKRMKRKYLERYEFMHVLAHELLTYETPSLVSPAKLPGQESNVEDDDEEERIMDVDEETFSMCHTVGDRKSNRKLSKKRCVVCQLDFSVMKTAISTFKKNVNNRVSKEKEEGLVASKGRHRDMSSCSCCPSKESGVGLTAHSFVLTDEEKKPIHSLFPTGWSCMEILHSEVGRELWKRKKSGGGKCLSCAVTRNHHCMEELRKIWKAKVSEALA